MILTMSRSALSSSPTSDSVLIRPAYPDDASTLVRLARLDSARPLSGRVVVAERDGVLLAARSLTDGRTIADPFASTADLVALLSVHAAETARAGARQAFLRRTGANLRRRPAFARG
jgi:hypothetical protein